MKARPLVVGAAVSVLLLAAFYSLAVFFTDAVEVVGFDASVIEFVGGWRTPGLTSAMKVVTLAGSTPAVTLGAIVLTAAMLLARRRDDALLSAIVVASGGLLSALAKGSFARSRPPAAEALISLPASFSLPSGHTLGSFCLAFAVAYTSLKSASPRVVKVVSVAVALSYALAVGVSRVYLGVHWPSDVVAAWLLGGAIAAAATGARESVRVRR